MARDNDACPCGAGDSYREHCAVVHQNGAGVGATAESLMRARYSAYVRHDRDFLMMSWHRDTRPNGLEFDPALTWLGLDVIDTVGGGALDSEGIVEFKARFSRGGEFLELHERSSFARVDGHWVYRSAVT